MGAMSPLASVMLLAFLFAITLSLLVWVLLQGRPTRQVRERDAAPREERAPRSARASDVRPRSNDEVRGARAASKRPSVGDDAFERFLRADREEGRR
jgi:type VI protein secretion system component VasK